MDKRTPERTCVGCGRKSYKNELVRIVLVNKDASGDMAGIALDSEGSMKGRGAYLCRNIVCLEQAVKKKAFNRAFKQAIGQELLEELKDRFTKEVK
jgi:hypothetical protein